MLRTKSRSKLLSIIPNIQSTARIDMSDISIISVPIGYVPRPASASRALLRLTPCHQAYRSPTHGEISGTPGSLELTGGEYKTRERIHRGIADPRLLAIPASRGRLQTSIRTGVDFRDLLHVTVLRPSVSNHCITCAAQGIKGHADLASSPPSSPVRGQSRLT